MASVRLPSLAYLVFACLAVAAPAVAQDRAALERARESMETGQELYTEGRFTEAAEQFVAAYNSLPNAAFLYNAAVSLENAGENARAAEYFERYLTADPGSADAADVRARILRLRGGGAPVNPPCPPENPNCQGGRVTPEQASDMKSLLSIDVDPPGATVTVSRAGQVVAQGSAPLVHTLDEGEYNLTVAHPDYETAQERLRIRPGNVYVVILNMRQGEFTGYFRVVTNPPGAQVFVDNREEGSVGNTPYQNVIPTGRHRIWIEKAGYRGEEEEFEVNVGENVVVRVDLTRVDFGRIRVVANVRGAHVAVDGNRVGQVPYEGDVPAGEHRITVSSDGMKDWSERLVVRNGQLTPIRVRLRPGVNRGGAYATAILSGVLLSGSLALGIMANNVESDLNRDRRLGILASDDSRILRGKIFAIGMDIALGLGLLTAGLAVYYFLRDPSPDSEGNVLEPRDWALAPALGPEGGGASFRWSF